MYSHRVLCVTSVWHEGLCQVNCFPKSLANYVNYDHRQEPEAAQPAEVATEVATETAEVLEAPAMEAEPVADAGVGSSEADNAVAEQQVTAF